MPLVTLILYVSCLYTGAIIRVPQVYRDNVFCNT